MQTEHIFMLIVCPMVGESLQRKLHVWSSLLKGCPVLKGWFSQDGLCVSIRKAQQFNSSGRSNTGRPLFTPVHPQNTAVGQILLEPKLNPVPLLEGPIQAPLLLRVKASIRPPTNRKTLPSCPPLTSRLSQAHCPDTRATSSLLQHFNPASLSQAFATCCPLCLFPSSHGYLPSPPAGRPGPMLRPPSTTHDL